MIRLPPRILGILSLALVAFAFSADTASTQATRRGKDVLEFIDLPVTGNAQASLDALLACRDGVMFELHAVDLLAQRPDGPHQWDISFAKDDGNLLIKEYPLWLGESERPLVRNGTAFPYSGLFTLLWKEPVPAQPLVTCVSGAGTGFCKTQLPIQDCFLNPWLVAQITQIGPRVTTTRLVDQLVFEVRAYDPEIGTNNGDGVARVEMSIVDPTTGTEVYYVERATVSTAGTGVVYCAFSEDCRPWVFAEHHYTWPSGTPVRNGYYLLRATVGTPDETRLAIQTQIEVDVPPTFETVYVPEGDFAMGSDAGSQHENPLHVVDVGEFWIMKTEVTNRQYAQCIRAGACTKPEDGDRWRDPTYADHPVTSVDWNQANDFAAWAGGRLPTEAEWEKACRGTDGRTFPWGNEPPTLTIANYGNAVADSTPVGSYPRNVSPYGALDMSGNAWEWTSSLIAPYPYRADDGREDKDSGERRVMRGGSYYYTHYQMVCTFRLPVGSRVANPQNGFRLVFDHPFVTENVAFVAPANGATVSSPFEVVMVANGLIVEPAGEIRAGAGHFHLLVDTGYVAPGELIPFDDNHLHFGQGQLTATLELEPGVHTLRLQFANGAHIALEGEQYQDEITVTVTY